MKCACGCLEKLLPFSKTAHLTPKKTIKILHIIKMHHSHQSAREIQKYFNEWQFTVKKRKKKKDNTNNLLQESPKLKI